jgi:hypothetical protein
LALARHFPRDLSIFDGDRLVRILPVCPSRVVKQIVTQHCWGNDDDGGDGDGDGDGDGEDPSDMVLMIRMMMLLLKMSSSDTDRRSVRSSRSVGT